MRDIRIKIVLFSSLFDKSNNNRIIIFSRDVLTREITRIISGTAASPVANSRSEWRLGSPAGSGGSALSKFPLYSVQGCIHYFCQASLYSPRSTHTASRGRCCLPYTLWPSPRRAHAILEFIARENSFSACNVTPIIAGVVIGSLANAFASRCPMAKIVLCWQ